MQKKNLRYKFYYRSSQFLSGLGCFRLRQYKKADISHFCLFICSFNPCFQKKNDGINTLSIKCLRQRVKFNTFGINIFHYICIWKCKNNAAR
jgi:hypothetical protein